MHRYQLETAYRDIDKYTGKAKNDGVKGYCLVDESGYKVHKEYVPFSGHIDRDSDEWIDRFDRQFFATPEEAWAAVPADKRIPSDTPLYKYVFHTKGEKENIYGTISKYCVEPGTDWFTVETLSGGMVMIAMSEVKMFTREVI